MNAFASVADLALLTGRVFTTEQAAQATALLEAASAYLRSVIGQDVYPATTTTYTAYPMSGREDIPQWPVASIDSVRRDGSTIDYTYRPGYILVSGDEPVSITFTWGYISPPVELNRLACVLAAQALSTIELGLGLTAGGLSSVAIDDFKAAFADGGASTGMTLSPHAEAAVRQRFGRGGADTSESV